MQIPMFTSLMLAMNLASCAPSEEDPMPTYQELTTLVISFSSALNIV